MNLWSKKKSNLSTSLKVREKAPLFSSNFAHVQRCTRKKKLIFRSSMKFSFQRIQDQWIWRPVQGDMARTLDVACSEICRDRLQRWDEIDIISCSESILGEWGLVGKENSCTSQWSNVSVHVLFWKLKEKIHEDEAAMGQRGIEGGDDDVKQWLGPWLSTRRSWRKLRQQRWRHIEDDIHTHEGRTSRIARWFIFSFHA